MDDTRKYRVTFTHEQLRIVNTALEEYFRVPLHQCSDLAERLAFRGFNYKDHTDADFDKRLLLRDATQIALKAAVEIAIDWRKNPKQPDEMAAIDMWQILRWELLPPETKKDAYRDRHFESDDPPIKVEVL